MLDPNINTYLVLGTCYVRSEPRHVKYRRGVALDIMYARSRMTIGGERGALKGPD